MSPAFNTPHGTEAVVFPVPVQARDDSGTAADRGSSVIGPGC